MKTEDPSVCEYDGAIGVTWMELI